MNYGSTGNGILSAFYGSLLVTSIISLVLIIFAIIVWWKIFAKAGYSGALGLLMFVPIANLIVILVLAFGEWPIYKELNYLRSQAQQAQQRNQQYVQTPQGPSSPQYPQASPQFPQSSPQYPQYGQPPRYPQG